MDRGWAQGRGGRGGRGGSSSDQGQGRGRGGEHAGRGPNGQDGSGLAEGEHPRHQEQHNGNKGALRQCFLIGVEGGGRHSA